MAPSSKHPLIEVGTLGQPPMIKTINSGNNFKRTTSRNDSLTQTNSQSWLLCCAHLQKSVLAAIENLCCGSGYIPFFLPLNMDRYKTYTMHFFSMPTCMARQLNNCYSTWSKLHLYWLLLLLALRLIGGIFSINNK